MENQEYLNQISAKSKPVKPANGASKFDISSILHSKYFLIGAIGIVALILIMIVGALLGGGEKKNPATDVLKFKYHLSSTTEIIDTYQPRIKSSILRSYNASLKNVISSITSDVDNYLTNVIHYEPSKDDETIIAEANVAKDELSKELLEAKINGILDRVYAHKMAYEITLLINEESSLEKTTKDDALKAILAPSKTSLENLYNNFNDFSETK